MQLDWIDENASRKYKDRNAATQKLIRRRATQAAVLTRQEQRQQTSQPRWQIQQVQSWVIDGSLRYASSSRWTNTEGSEEPSAVAGRRTFATTPTLTSSYSFGSSSQVLQRLIDAFQGQTPTHKVFQKLVAGTSVPDEQVRYFKTLALTDAEYLQSINSHYGQSGCLDAAIDCLTARIQDFLAGTAGRASTLRLYARALQLLQQSIATNPFPERFEIYYAIPLLVLFELLVPSDQLTYLTHGRGAVHLLHFIGADGMQTELDKTLLAMQSDIMVVENLQDGYPHCCAAPEWQRALRRTIRDDLPPGATRSEANITLNVIATALPDAFNHVERVVTKPSAEGNNGLQNKLQLLMILFQGWQYRWEPILSADLHESSTRKVLLAIFWMYTAILYRLLAAAPGRPEQRSSSELKALEVANNALEIAAEPRLHSSVGQTRLDIVRKFVHSIAETSNVWQQTLKHTVPDQPISPTLFMDWCTRLGRKSEVEP